MGFLSSLRSYVTSVVLMLVGIVLVLIGVAGVFLGGYTSNPLLRLLKSPVGFVVVLLGCGVILYARHRLVRRRADGGRAQQDEAISEQ